MDEQLNRPIEFDTKQASTQSYQPLINPDDLGCPVAILSLDDGIVLYANSEFRKVFKSVKVGRPIKGFLDSAEKRNSINNILLKKNKHISVQNAPQHTLRFCVTKGKFVDSDHYIFTFEKQDKNITATQQTQPTRESFIDHLTKMINQEVFLESEVCVCAIDIDRFKVVNEKYGYAVGDFLLKEFFRLVDENISRKHYMSRLGDNEYGLILENTSIDDAVQICEEIRAQVKANKFTYKDEAITITVSIGVVTVDGQENDIEGILSQATLALNAAKENGRDCVHSSATPDTMMAYHSGKMHYAMVIEDALQKDKFELFAQPIASLDNPSKHYSYEVLLRIYDHIEKEFISSQELITAAESLEVTSRIDRYVCEKVFKLLSEKLNAGIKLPNISINLSGHSIVSAAFEEFLIELTDKYNIPTSSICFEITESVAVKSVSRAQNFIRNLKKIGYRFSLDDFGVGYCSFNYLNLLDVDNVKIDGSFVSAMLDDATQFATVQAITNVARTMNIKTIAEFVEKPEIIKALKVIGVDYGQGYIFGKPSTINDIFNHTADKGS